jgi:hypothetical protein
LFRHHCKIVSFEYWWAVPYPVPFCIDIWLTEYSAVLNRKIFRWRHIKVCYAFAIVFHCNDPNRANLDRSWPSYEESSIVDISIFILICRTVGIKVVITSRTCSQRSNHLAWILFCHKVITVLANSNSSWRFLGKYLHKNHREQC